MRNCDLRKMLRHCGSARCRCLWLSEATINWGSRLGSIANLGLLQDAYLLWSGCIAVARCRGRMLQPVRCRTSRCRWRRRLSLVDALQQRELYKMPKYEGGDDNQLFEELLKHCEMEISARCWVVVPGCIANARCRGRMLHH